MSQFDDEYTALLACSELSEENLRAMRFYARYEAAGIFLSDASPIQHYVARAIHLIQDLKNSNKRTLEDLTEDLRCIKNVMQIFFTRKKEQNSTPLTDDENLKIRTLMRRAEKTQGSPDPIQQDLGVVIGALGIFAIVFALTSVVSFGALPVLIVGAAGAVALIAGFIKCVNNSRKGVSQSMVDIANTVLSSYPRTLFNVDVAANNPMLTIAERKEEKQTLIQKM